MCTPLFQKPKRTLSNLSQQQLQNAKMHFRQSFKDYRQKFCYQPDWEVICQDKSSTSKYQKQKKELASKALGGRHTYSVQHQRSQKNIINGISKQQINSHRQDKLKKKRPSTANFSSHKKQNNDKLHEKKQIQQIHISLNIFQNKHLSLTLQQSQMIEKQKQVKQFEENKSSINRSKKKSTSLCNYTYGSKNQNTFIIKTGVSQPSAINHRSYSQKTSIYMPNPTQAIKLILSPKQNFYNPHNIRPKNPYSKPVKHLRNNSIQQLQQLCRQERNMNFQNVKISKNLGDGVELKQNIKGHTKQIKKNNKKYLKKNSVTRFKLLDVSPFENYLSGVKKQVT